MRPLSSAADFDSLHCSHTLRYPLAPVAPSARLPHVEKLLLNALQFKRAIRQGCVVSFIVMVKLNTPVIPHTDVSSGSASVTSDSTSPDSAAALDFAFSCQLPPDRGVELVIPLEPDAKPPFKQMYRLSPSEVKVTELQE